MTAPTAPGVFVREISVFPPSVAEVSTAIPAFVGYTAKAASGVTDLTLVPTKIRSLPEYQTLFGGPEVLDIVVSVDTDDAGAFFTKALKPDPFRHNSEHTLFYAVKMYFANGGGPCYIVSVGSHDEKPKAGDDNSGLISGLKRLRLEDEPTLLVVPEAVHLAKGDDYAKVVAEMLQQCGDLGDRFAILDIYDGTNDDGGRLLDDKDDANKALLDVNRDYFGTTNLAYGAAYYPFVVTRETHFVKESDTESNVKVKFPATAAAVDLVKFRAGGANENTSLYNYVKRSLDDHRLTMPPCGAVAGVYAATDAARGVWKAPANVSVGDVIGPLVSLDDSRQGELNVDATGGKSINALRAFAGKGTLVWGARTLDGNSNEWRYVPVRRFFNMVEESVKKSTSWAVFEPNDANTWVKVRGMIENYLTDKWRDGALAGATTKDAFFVKCGLGVTMTAQDILEGRMNVEIGMAVVRPAEFIILKFSHKMQVS
jgi:phage tail sheath protein FI